MNRRLWGWPLALAGSTLLGLSCALVGGGGVWWGISWIGLAMPVLLVTRGVIRSPTGYGRQAGSIKQR